MMRRGLPIVLAVAVLALVALQARLSERARIRGEAARDRLDTIEDARGLRDETETLDDGALRRELDQRLSRPGPR